ncbi:2OG-Fe(II) oxygenase [Granulicella sp. WH15]|uniref:2OG-Fe(II) oxygenase n=1 Tax=Granulicella sp. WH15 TaxID=2602070 RepID=UPI00136769F9|nr:2OG-Fe(II) oxygenase [Granulicella sp. WH15]QHN04326.1 2OG-Fe(II) oxygenase [Granulicella sp. WH15]
MNRREYAAIIESRLREESDRLSREFGEHTVQSCYIDNLLPEDEVKKINAAFPDKDTMMLKKSLRENKYVAAQMDKYNPILEEIIYAFQDPRVVKAVEEITGIQEMLPDTHLYAGGISLMAKNNFLNPHLDNSHDKDRKLYRVLNLLFYVTPDWSTENGGNLELWDDGPKKPQREITSHFNRLALMATHKTSWHSVSEVKVDRSRCCVSNYYFSEKPLEEHEYFHVTSFRGRPEQPVRDVILQTDIALRQSIRKIFKKGVVENSHVYLKDEETNELPGASGKS